MLGGMSVPQQPAQNPPQLPPYASQPPQTGYPGQPPQMGYPGQQPATNVNAAGKAGLILGIAALGANIITSIVFQFMIRGDAYQLYGVVNGVGSLLAFAAALAALVLGLIGLRRHDAPKGIAGIATGIGLAVVVGIVFGFLVNAVGSLMYF